METIIEIIKHEIERIKLKYKVEINDRDREILELKNKIAKLKKENKIKLIKSTKIRWSEDKRYYNLSDFCRVSRDILFINETNLKQYLETEGILIKKDNKYIPSNTTDLCIFVNNELYIDYSYIRNHIMFLRTCIYLDKDESLEDFIQIYYTHKDILCEKMSNTVYVECKQRSKEFSKCKENKFFTNSSKEQIK